MAIDDYISKINDIYIEDFRERHKNVGNKKYSKSSLDKNIENFQDGCFVGCVGCGSLTVIGAVTALYGIYKLFF
ncbi:MAG: hypothetical protein AABW56_02070 [Nanoarchaeota archaeon]